MHSKVTFRISSLNRSSVTVTSDGIQSLKVEPGQELKMTLGNIVVILHDNGSEESAPVNMWIRALDWCGKLDTDLEQEN